MAQDQSLGTEQKLLQSAAGVQRLLVISKVPTGGDASLVGKTLLSAGALTVNGTYRCLIPIAGLASILQLYLTATIVGGTVSTDLDILYFISSVADDSSWSKKLVTVTGDGALASATRQSASTTAVNGEQYALVDIALSGVTSVTFTQAEYNGK